MLPIERRGVQGAGRPRSRGARIPTMIVATLLALGAGAATAQAQSIGSGDAMLALLGEDAAANADCLDEPGSRTGRALTGTGSSVFLDACENSILSFSDGDLPSNEALEETFLKRLVVAAEGTALLGSVAAERAPDPALREIGVDMEDQANRHAAKARIWLDSLHNEETGEELTDTLMGSALADEIADIARLQGDRFVDAFVDFGIDHAQNVINMSRPVASVVEYDATTRLIEDTIEWQEAQVETLEEYRQHREAVKAQEKRVKEITEEARRNVNASNESEGAVGNGTDGGVQESTGDEGFGIPAVTTIASLGAIVLAAVLVAGRPRRPRS